MKKIDAVTSARGADSPGTDGEDLAVRRLLVVDDDPAYRKLSSMALHQAGIEHTSVGSAGDAIAALKENGTEAFDLILLDMELPGMKGWDLLRVLRESGCDIPVVLVTVMSDVRDKVRALDLGADDYVVKPFSFDELLSRLTAVLRRAPRRERVRVGDVELDPFLRRARCGGRALDLTPREFELLMLLVKADGRVVEKADFLREVWNMDGRPGTNFLQVHFSRLKQKLALAKAVRIETIHGRGYRLVAEGQADEQQAI